jgi:alkylhydroperoxidase/carboxymuconolactone decarboxylase family protein YurZ
LDCNIVLNAVGKDQLEDYLYAIYEGNAARDASKKEIAEAISIAMFIAGGAQLGWTNDLGKSAYDLIFKEKNLKN